MKPLVYVLPKRWLYLLAASEATAGLVALAVGSTLIGSFAFVSITGAILPVVVFAGEAPHPAILKTRKMVMKNEVNFFKCWNSSLLN